MNDLRELLEAGPVRTLPVEALASRPDGMNAVRDYYDPRLDRYLNGKIVEPPPHAIAERLPREQWLPALLLEGQLQEQLKGHPNVMPVVAVLDVHDPNGEVPDGAVEIFTPHLPLGSAWDMVRRGTGLRANEAVRVVRDAALGLAVLHELGYVHRDVKSPNVFVEQTPMGLRGLIGDLGLAHAVAADGAAPGWPQPTPWIAPEQMTPNATATVTSDLFGLGATLVDLTRPFDFDGYERGRAASRMARGDLPMAAKHYVPPPWLPREVRQLVSRLTAKDPARRRPATARQVADALDCAVPPWVGDPPDNNRVYFHAEGTTPVDVTARLRPRVGEWEITVRADKGGGPRRVWRVTFDTEILRSSDLVQAFDVALSYWSR